MNSEQALIVARRYCEIRGEQDGLVHDPVQQTEVAQIFAAWFMAFKEYVDRGGPLTPPTTAPITCDRCGNTPCPGCQPCCGSTLGRDPEDGSCRGCG